MKIKPIRQINTITPQYQTNMAQTFDMPNDSFEKSNKTETVELKQKNGKPWFVEYNGKDKAYIFKKVFNPETQQIEKEKIEVCVGKRQFGSVCSYYLFDKKAKIELGYITIREERGNFADSALSKDYPEYGIIGARINIDFVENVYPDEYSGVGEVADQIALEHCIKENMPLQIVSTAEKGSVIAHYKRGRKFFPVEGRDALRFIVEFGTNDPNKIIEERIKQNPDNKNIYCDDILGTYMYMPKEVVAKYLERIKENTILH